MATTLLISTLLMMITEKNTCRRWNRSWNSWKMCQWRWKRLLITFRRSLMKTLWRGSSLRSGSRESEGIRPYQTPSLRSIRAQLTRIDARSLSSRLCLKAWGTRLCRWTNKLWQHWKGSQWLMLMRLSQKATPSIRSWNACWTCWLIQEWGSSVLHFICRCWICLRVTSRSSPLSSTNLSRSSRNPTWPPASTWFRGSRSFLITYKPFLVTSQKESSIEIPSHLSICWNEWEKGLMRLMLRWELLHLTSFSKSISSKGLRRSKIW